MELLFYIISGCNAENKRKEVFIMSKREEIKKAILQQLQRENELRNMSDEEFEAFLQKNEEFVGTELDAEKAAVLEEMKEECKLLSCAMPGLRFEVSGIDERSRNGSVRLYLPLPVFITAEPVVKRLARLYALAEGIAMANGGSRLILSFHVYGLWK